MADGSSARVGSAKPWAAAAAIGALQDHARRHEIDAAIEPAQGYGLYSWTHRPGSASTLISVIATGGQAADLERLREATAYPRVEWIAAEAGPEWPAAVNAAVRRAKGRHVAIVDSRLAPASADWLERLVAQLAYPPTAIVTPRIDGADGVIASVGLALGVGAGWAPVLEGAESTTLGYFGNAVVPHECAAASHACLVVPRTVLEAAGGFDERLGPDGAAVALSLAVRRGGSHVVCAADVRLQWQLPQQPPDSRDAERLRPAWPAALVNDPYFNRNFDRARADFRLERTSRSGE
jgi:hypothetical protein